jgi:REP element-mobilizing transposase RayT
MPRELRKIINGVTYHCYSRCHDKKDLFHSSHVKKYFVDAIVKCQEKYSFELIAAEPVGNHIHLIIKTVNNRETVSLIMQYIKARIAEKYNRSTGRTGAFWNERFGSTIIEEAGNPEEYLLWLLWYIGYNPVRKGLSRDPRDNYIGFINCYLEKDFKTSIKITLHKFFNNLGNTFEECVKEFLKYEEIYLKRLMYYY